MKLLIMIPAHNEALNIRQVVQHLQSICPEYDYLIINDGSRDATARICRENRYPVLDLPGEWRTEQRHSRRHVLCEGKGL